MSRRCFIGVPVSRNVRDKLADVRDSIKEVGFQKPVPTEQFHITLAFLGDVREKDLHKIKKQLANVNKHAFKTTIKGIGFFPGKDYISVVWAGIESKNKQLIDLANNVREQIPDRYPDNKEFHPHITLSRVKSLNPDEKQELQEKQRKHTNTLLGSFTLSQFTLYESTLTGSGPEYKELASYSLS